MCWVLGPPPMPGQLVRSALQVARHSLLGACLARVCLPSPLCKPAGRLLRTTSLLHPSWHLWHPPLLNLFLSRGLHDRAVPALSLEGLQMVFQLRQTLLNRRSSEGALHKTLHTEDAPQHHAFLHACQPVACLAWQPLTNPPLLPPRLQLQASVVQRLQEVRCPRRLRRVRQVYVPEPGILHPLLSSTGPLQQVQHHVGCVPRVSE